MCSACSGDYEDPEMSAPEPEIEELEKGETEWAPRPLWEWAPGSGQRIPAAARDGDV